MSDENRDCVPSYTPPRRSRSRRTRSKSKDKEEVPRKRQKKSRGLTADDLMKIVSALKDSSSKTTPTTNVVPEFNPDNKSQDIDRWLRKVNECAVIYNWDNKQTIHYALQKLNGLAKSWYESLPSLDYTWDLWQSKLRKAFPNDVNFGKLLEEMLNRKTRVDETLREYFYDKLSLLSRCEIVGRKAVDCIIYGITDSSIRNGAQALKCEEPEDLLNYLASQQPTQTKDSSKGPLTNNNSYKKRDFRGSNNTSNNANSSKNVDFTCFNCNERGHTYHNCTKPLVKCAKCGRVGHNLDNCTRKPLQSHINGQNNQAIDRKVYKVVTDQKAVPINNHASTDYESVKGFDKLVTFNNVSTGNDPNQKFYKKICVNGVMLDAYVDFGSDCSLIQYSIALKLNLNQCHVNLPVIRGFGDSFVTPKFKSLISVRIDEIETDLTVLAVEDSYLQVDLLIGQNFTELASVTVLKDKENLFFYHTSTDEFIKDRTLNLYVLQDVTIRRGGLVEIYTMEPYSGDIYSDGSTRMSPNQEYHLHQGCYRVNNSKAYIFVTALTNSALEFKANSLIARVSPITETRTFTVKTQESNLTPLDINDIKIGIGIDEPTKKRVYQLLQKYRNCFATSLSELGCAKDAIMTINLYDKTPVIYRPYRLSHDERQKVRGIIAELIDNDIVQESNSNYASPILVVKKKNGESRLCVDYRALNSKTVKDKYPLPLIDDQLSNLSGNRFFITLDLASGYYQIPMGEESRHLTAFVTPDGHYEFKRMPFGLANAPAVFQKMMNRLLGPRRFKSALAYMDDLLIPSVSIDEGFERLEDVLKVIQEAGLTLKLEKCSFFDTVIEYLGYEISADGIKPSERKIIAVRDFPEPRNVHEVRQFLGLASYFRRFVKGFGEIARPLTSLLKKDVRWQWSDVEAKSFNILKDRLVQRPLLALYNPSLDTEVHTDASALGLGGILMQWQTCPKVLKPVAYFSRQTTPEERYFHSYELETLAVVCTLKKFRSYILGLHFRVYTDCNALRTTLTKRDLIPRIARWWLTISEYNFDIEYRPGCRMSHVDALSRNPPGRDVNAVVETHNLNINTDNWILTLQLADPKLDHIFKILKPSHDPNVLEIKKNYVIKNHTLYRKVGEELRLVIPKDARWQICKANHDDVGHFGFAKTFELIQSRYWFPKLRRFIKKYVAACIDCAYNKDNAARAHTGYLHPIEKVAQPFHTLHLDHLGPFVKSKAGKAYILTIVDGFTKYLFARAVKDTKTKTVVKVLDCLFNDFGVPNRIISDRGTAFTSNGFKEFCHQKGIKHVLNAVACPRANGQAERFNQTILTALSVQNFAKDERDWDIQLGRVQWGINNTVNATTKKSASELLFGTKLHGPLDNKLTAESTDTETDVLSLPNVFDDSVRDLSCQSHTTSEDNSPELGPNSPVIITDTSSVIDKVRKEASVNIELSQERQKANYDSKRSPAVVYSVGDLVKITKTNFKNDGKSKKLLPKFIGPYRVSKCLGNDRYEISNVPGFKTNKYKSVIASDRMRPWIHIPSLQVNKSSGSESSASESDDMSIPEN